MAGPGLGAVRIDSGDLALYAREVRAQLDALGATGTRIVLTGDLDEHSIAALAAAPVDGYGVGHLAGHRLGRADRRAGLQARRPGREDDGSGPLQPVAKRSVGKPSRGGRKWAVREIGPDGRATAERVTDTPPEPGAGRRRCSSSWCATARSSAASPSTPPGPGTAPRSRSCPPHARPLSRGYPAIPTTFTPDTE